MPASEEREEVGQVGPKWPILLYKINKGGTLGIMHFAPADVSEGQTLDRVQRLKIKNWRDLRYMFTSEEAVSKMGDPELTELWRVSVRCQVSAASAWGPLNSGFGGKNIFEEAQKEFEKKKTAKTQESAEAKAKKWKFKASGKKEHEDAEERREAASIVIKEVLRWGMSTHMGAAYGPKSLYLAPTSSSRQEPN